jgi:hypothetical protein
MEERTIQLSDKAYQRLLEKSARLHTTPSEFIEQLLDESVTDLPPTAWPETVEDDPDDPWPPRETTVEEALAAVERLTTLFADIHIENIEDVLNDPTIMSVDFELPKFQ